MTIHLVKKPPTNRSFNERFLIKAPGNHTLKQKIAMFLDGKFLLEHEHGIRYAGQTDFYVSLVDQWGHPLTHFANGDAIADWSMIVNSAYHCAADSYQP
jgi:hypothetical protein